MSKFKITKRFSLKDLGPDWADCYLDFSPFTMREVANDELLGLSKLDDPKTSPEAVVKGFDTIVGLLKKKFVGGKGIAADGSTVDIGVGDLEELPAEILSGVLRFLSQGLASGDKTPSGK